MPVTPIDTNQIVITASRAPEQEAKSPASVTIIDKKRIERLGEPLIGPLLRISPSVSLTKSGPAGSLTEVRIRGAEANHTLVFIDEIKINDPAGDGSARFELLNADLASQIEIVRGPQSALWGSEAIGGVIAINGVQFSRLCRRRRRRVIWVPARKCLSDGQVRPLQPRRGDRLATRQRHQQRRRARRQGRLPQSLRSRPSDLEADR